MRNPISIFAMAAAMAAAMTAATAGEFDAALEALAQDRLRAIAADPALIEAIRAQNTEHAALGQPAIDAMDKDWRAQVGQSPAPLIDTITGKSASSELARLRDEGEGLFTEIFAMDNLGLNVAVSDVTSDYWQGDEAKWQQTFLVGADALHISEVELDESTQTYQSQVSLTVVDPDTNAPIGAITFGVNVEHLQ